VLRWGQLTTRQIARWFFDSPRTATNRIGVLLELLVTSNRQARTALRVLQTAVARLCIVTVGNNQRPGHLLALELDQTRYQAEPTTDPPAAVTYRLAGRDVLDGLSKGLIYGHHDRADLVSAGRPPRTS
jgi:hypothetical protein